ncbi:MAG: hypothetical protein J6Z82_02920 [Schwartzia sp.]|nr:hypothetical protein [Schwartzia sp. (in: firmicutes)]
MGREEKRQTTDRLLSSSEYLRHRYEIPETLPDLPLSDESFAAEWREASGAGVLDFLAEGLGLPAFDFSWENRDALKIAFAKTLGGQLPTVATESHADFRRMEALLNARAEAAELSPTVNAFAFEARAKRIYRHRVLLLNYAPYSNIPSEAMGLSQGEWLERSHRLRLRHEGAHYETLRLFGGMRNHALDEILADGMGQIAAFGSFDADRQRIFFGLTRGGDTCTGRLSFYCQNVRPEERAEVYRTVDAALDDVAGEINERLKRKEGDAALLLALAGRSLAERLEAKK